MSLGFGLGFSKQKGLAPVFSANEKSTPNASLYSGDEGIVVVDSTATTPYTRTNFETVFSFYSNNNNRFELFHRDAETFQIIVTVGGVSQTAEIINTIAGVFLPYRQRFVIRWKDGSLQIYMNGEEIYYVESGLSFPDTVSNIYLAQRVADLQGDINYIALYNKGSTENFARNLSKNSTGIITSLTHDATRRGVIFAGQSNSVGVASTGSHTYNNTNKLLTNSGDYEDYSDPADDDTDTLIGNSVLSDTAALGYQGLVVDALKTANSDYEWFAVTGAKGNTEIADWIPYTTSFTVADRVIADTFHALVNRALMAKQAGSLNYTVWHQGESDAIAGTSKADYKAAVLEMLTEYRKVVGAHPIILVSLHKWVDTLNSTHGATQAEWAAIQTAQSELATENSWITLVDISDIEATQDDGLHLAQAEQVIVAERINAAIKQDLTANPAFYRSFTSQTSTIDITSTRTTTAPYIDEDGEWNLAAANEPIFMRAFKSGELVGLMSQVDRTNKVEYARPSADTVTDHFDTGSGSVSVVTDATAPIKSTFTNNDQVWQVAASGSDVTLEWAGAVGNTNKHNMQLMYVITAGSDDLSCTLSIGGEGELVLNARVWAWGSKVGITPASSTDKMRLVVPDGATINFFFADMQEDNPSGTKYLPHLTMPIDTAGAAAARGDEIVSIGGFGTMGSQGSFYARATLWGGETGQDGFALSDSSGVTSNVISKRMVDNGDEKFYFTAGGVDEAIVNYGVRERTPRHNAFVCAWDSSNVFAYEQGAEVLNETVTASPTGLDRFYLRDTQNSSLRSTLILHDLQIFNSKLSAANAQEVSIGKRLNVFLVGSQSNINKIMLYPNTNIVFRGDGEVEMLNEAFKYIPDLMIESLFEPNTQSAAAMLKRNAQTAEDAASKDTYLYDEDTGTLGNVWDIAINDHLAVCGVTSTNVKAIGWDQWQFDLSADQSDPTTIPIDLWKEGTKFVFAYLRSLFPNATIYNQLPAGRQSTDEASVNAFRTAQLEIADELAYVLNFSSPADFSYQDVAHYQDADYITIGLRWLRYYMKANSIIDLHGVYGATITGASGIIGNTYIDVDITHDAGTDFTPTSSIQGFGIYKDGEVITLSSQDRQDADTIRLTLGEAVEDASYELFYLLGNNYTWYDSTVRDNSGYAMPLNFVTNFDVTVSDFFGALDNQAAYMDAADSSKTYSSGSNVSDIDTVSGTVSGFNISGTEPVFSTDHLVLDTDTILDYDTDYGATGNQTIVFAIETPPTLPSFGSFITFTNTVGTVTANAQLYLRSNGNLVYSQNEAASNQTITTGIGASEKLIIMLDFVSTSSVDVYVNGHNTATINFDPHDTYSSKVRVKVGASQIDNGIGKLYGYLHTLDSLTPTEREGAFDAMNGRYGFGL